MRFSYFLLVVGVIFASHDIVSAAADTDQTKLSKAILPDAAHSVLSLDAANEKRFLRTRTTANEEVEEERGLIQKWATKMAERVDSGVLPSFMRKRYNIGNGATAKQKIKYDLFVASFGQKYPKGVNEKGFN